MPGKCLDAACDNSIYSQSRNCFKRASRTTEVEVTAGNCRAEVSG